MALTLIAALCTPYESDKDNTISFMHVEKIVSVEKYFTDGPTITDEKSEFDVVML